MIIIDVPWQPQMSQEPTAPHLPFRNSKKIGTSETSPQKHSTSIRRRSKYAIIPWGTTGANVVDESGLELNCQ